MITIGSRGSALARTQSQQVASQLAALGQAAQLQIISTRGDRVVDRPFTDMPGKGCFTVELEAALRAHQVDLAVHSLKDLPTEDAPGLQVMAITAREDPRDTLVVAAAAYRPERQPLPLPPAARVGTSAVRRVAQLRALRPDLQVSPLRGNVPTRLQRLLEGKFDAIVLAQAGLNRLQLDLQGCIAVPLAPAIFVPAPGQGALALQARRQDGVLQPLLQALHAAADAACVGVERQLLAQVEGGCHAPLGAYAWQDAAGMHLHVFYQPASLPQPIVATLHAQAPAALGAAAIALVRRGMLGH